MSDKVKLHEYADDEEFYAQFIQVRSAKHSVLVFNYDDDAREFAERIAGLMGDDFEWVDNRITFEDDA